MMLTRYSDAAQTAHRYAERAQRETFASRFWTIPAHQSPIGRRMAAKAGA